jgi:hypothetical protein
MTLNQAIETAKAKSAGNAKWTRAVEKAAAALVNGEIRVHLFGGFALVASKNGCYKVTDRCECSAAQNGHRECYHRSAARITELMEETAPAVETKRQPTITRSIETTEKGIKLNVVRCDGWVI